MNLQDITNLINNIQTKYDADIEKFNAFSEIGKVNQKMYGLYLHLI